MLQGVLSGHTWQHYASLPSRSWKFSICRFRLPSAVALRARPEPRFIVHFNETRSRSAEEKSANIRLLCCRKPIGSSSSTIWRRLLLPPSRDKVLTHGTICFPTFYVGYPCRMAAKLSATNLGLHMAILQCRFG
ncbi:hypothetical protein RvY_05790-3 [Ramazzottius varieornatus]|nr:hypothetical protein RvY_05790-3 [Ramazzottius varieornatus]